jgi:hypothetical protein
MGQLTIFSSGGPYTLIVTSVIPTVGKFVRCTFHFVNIFDDSPVKKKKGGDDDVEEEDDPGISLCCVGLWKQMEGITAQSGSAAPVPCSTKRVTSIASAFPKKSRPLTTLTSNFILGIDSQSLGYYNIGNVYNGSDKGSLATLSEFGEGDNVSVEINLEKKIALFFVNDKIQSCVVQNVPDNVYFAVWNLLMITFFFFFFRFLL